jgi:hypothetical protein
VRGLSDRRIAPLGRDAAPEGCDLLILLLWRGSLLPLGCAAAPETWDHYKTLWRGGSSDRRIATVDCEAVAKPNTAVCLTKPDC